METEEETPMAALDTSLLPWEDYAKAGLIDVPVRQITDLIGEGPSANLERARTLLALAERHPEHHAAFTQKVRHYQDGFDLARQMVG